MKTATLIDLEIGDSELAYHDLQRALKIRKPMAQKFYGGVLAIDRGLDAWHHDAFIGTGVEDAFAGIGTPRAVVYNLIDWVGNVIGQIEPPDYEIGQLYNIRKLGLDKLHYELTAITAELMPDGVWWWCLEFKFPKPINTTSDED